MLLGQLVGIFISAINELIINITLDLKTLLKKSNKENLKIKWRHILVRTISRIRMFYANK